MTATKTLRFGEGFILEPAEFQHKQLAVEWTDADPDHSGRVDPRFWLEQDDDRDSYLCSDRQGPVLFFKLILKQTEQHTQECQLSYMSKERAQQESWGCTCHHWGRIDFPRKSSSAELHMQFMPAVSMQDHERIRAALLAGAPWIEQILMRAGVEEICFDSRSPGLIAFTTKRLGFSAPENGILRKRLAGHAATSK